MPWIKTPANITVRKLFSGKMTEKARATGITRRTLYNKKKDPGKITLAEFGPLSADLNDDEIVEIVRAWK